ncbi:MAG: hypothetical protein R2822_23025 [Spirosomataceae bacterium]
MAYGRISGTGSGYGFFAPNVKANGLILGDCDGTIISPEFRSYESSVRFNSLSSRVTDYLVDMGDSISIEKQQMEAQYYDLLFKNIAVKMYGQHHCRSDTFYVSYNILTFPTLAQFRQRKGVGEHKLRPVKEVKLTKLDYK